MRPYVWQSYVGGMYRRQLITAVGTGLVALFAGCTNNEPGDSKEPLDGEWVLRARVANEDDEPREWRVESRSEDRESFAAASGTILPGGEHELELRGLLYDEQREIYVVSDGGSRSESWRPTECPRFFADVSIVNGNPNLETECREE